MEMIFKGRKDRIEKLRKELRFRLRNDGIVTKEVTEEEMPVKKKRKTIKK